MKEYNRKTKKWEEKTTEQVGELKKKEMCRGGKAHQIILTMPPYGHNRVDLSQEVIQQYYESEEKILEFKKEETKKMQAIGLPVKMPYKDQIYRYTKCEVCGKKYI